MLGYIVLFKKKSSAIKQITKKRLFSLNKKRSLCNIIKMCYSESWLVLFKIDLLFTTVTSWLVWKALKLKDNFIDAEKYVTVIENTKTHLAVLYDKSQVEIVLLQSIFKFQTCYTFVKLFHSQQFVIFNKPWVSPNGRSHISSKLSWVFFLFTPFCAECHGILLWSAPLVGSCLRCSAVCPHSVK